MKPVLVEDVVAHLLTLPQKSEVWWHYDEGGYYYPVQSPRQGCIVRIKKEKVWCCKNRKEWKENRHGKRVVILQEDMGESMARMEKAFKAKQKAKKAKKCVT